MGNRGLAILMVVLMAVSALSLAFVGDGPVPADHPAAGTEVIEEPPFVPDAGTLGSLMDGQFLKNGLHVASDGTPTTAGAYRTTWYAGYDAIVIQPASDTDGPVIGPDHTPTIVEVSSQLVFNVTISDESGVQNASVEYWQGTGSHRSRALTRATGDAKHGTYTASYTPYGSLTPLEYIFYATDTSANANQTTAKRITLQDTTPPWIDDLTPWRGSPTTGDPFQFVANVSDNLGIAEVRIFFTIGDPPWVDVNTTMEPLFTSGSHGTYVHNITIPSHLTEPIIYTLVATDTSNNVNQLFNGANITDNDAPELGNDTSDPAGTTGDPLTLMINASDNVGVGTVFVNYWYPASPVFNRTMTPMTVDARGNGSYQHVVNLPTDFVGSLSYRFYASDMADIWNRTSVVDIDVTDDDPPTVGPDGSHAVGEDWFAFEVNASDNVGVDEVWVVYQFQGQSSVNTTLDATSVDAGGNGTYGNLEVAVPIDQQVRIDYKLWAKDAAGKARFIKGTFIRVDLDPPEFGANGTWGEPVKGWDIALWVEVWDNMALGKVTVEYWFGDGTHETVAMVGEGDDKFNITVHLPRTPDGDLNYVFRAVDVKGNHNNTPQRTLALVNVAPRISGPEVWEVTEGSVGVLDMAPYLTDGNDPHASLSMSVDLEAVTVDRLRLQVTYDMWVPEHQITLTVTDGEDSTTLTFLIQVINVNDDLVITSEPGTTGEVGEAYEYIVTFTDEDPSDTHVFALDVKPDGMTIDGSGRIDWTPGEGQMGAISVDLAIFDGSVYIHQTWTVTVTGPVNEPPAFTNSPELNHTSGTTYRWDAEANDPDGDTLAFELLSGPEGAAMDAVTGLLEWEPPTDKRDTEDDFAFEVRVSDAWFDVDLDFTLHLTYITNQAPVVGEGIATDKVKDMVRINLTGYMSDPDDSLEDLYWTVEEDEDIFVADIDGHDLVIYSVPGSKGTGELTLKLHDPWGLVDGITMEVTVDASTEETTDGDWLSSFWWIIIIVLIALTVLLWYTQDRWRPGKEPEAMEEPELEPAMEEETSEESLDELLDELS